jgi:hypothetical protein
VTGNYGYVSEGIAGYCYGSQVAGTLPFYRYWNNYEHFYTTNANEIGTTSPGTNDLKPFTAVIDEL